MLSKYLMHTLVSLKQLLRYRVVKGTGAKNAIPAFVINLLSRFKTVRGRRAIYPRPISEILLFTPLKERWVKERLPRCSSAASVICLHCHIVKLFKERPVKCAKPVFEILPPSSIMSSSKEGMRAIC